MCQQHGRLIIALAGDLCASAGLYPTLLTQAQSWTGYAAPVTLYLHIAILAFHNCLLPLLNAQDRGP